MKILIPTAKELNKKATPQETLELSEKSNEIVAEFAKLSASDLAKVYKIKEDKAMEEFSRWQDIKNNTAKSYKALDLFNGLMYRNIDRDNFDEADKEYIEKNVFITTSLYGIIGAYDLIQEHRLDFLQNVKISGESLKNFWRDSYDESIKDEDFVVSLLSSEFEEVFSKNQKEKFIKKIKADEEITIYGDGNTSRDYTYIKDIINGIYKSFKYLNAHQNIYEIINLGSSREIKLMDMIKIIEDKLNKKAKIRFENKQAGDVDKTFACIDKAKKILNYKVSTKFEDGIENFIRWYKRSF